jgi:hypothetical protein
MKKFFAVLCLTEMVFSIGLYAQIRSYYHEPKWKPRISLTYDEVVNGTFWPKSPEVDKGTPDKSFDFSRLGKIPAPGVHPRVLITPDEVDMIREKVAMGDKAPLQFRALWERVKAKQTPFYALVMKDKTLGRKYADQLMEKVHRLIPKLDKLDKLSDTENLWSAERSFVAMGEPDPPIEIWHLLEYDYIAPWMTQAERNIVNGVIARITEHRVTNFMMVPDHFMINNHQGFGMEYIRLMLLIEGEKGFNKKLFDRASQKAYAMLDHFLDADGMCYETIKGWLNTSAFVAVGLRHPELLQHPHLRAKMHFFNAAMWWQNGSWKVRDEMRASAFHPIWMMHYYHPHDEYIDFLYKATLTTHPFLTDSHIRWPNPVGICEELLLLYADDGMKDKDGRIIDWRNQDLVNRLNLPLVWTDNQRGYMYVRNSWKEGDMQVAMSCKQDFFYGGHEGTEDNRIILWKDGVNWIKDNDMLATKATFLQNMITVDGKGCKWPPAPSTWLGVQDSPEAITATGDGRMGFSYSKVMQVHPYYFPSSQVPYYKPFAEANRDLTRDIQIAYHPGTIKFNDGYAHTDYGPWSSETRLVEGYKTWNTMKNYFRTVQMGKGKYPYLIVIDDAQKDDNSHLYEWNISVPLDVDLVDAITPEIRFQNTDPDFSREDDLILGRIGLPRDSVSGKTIIPKGEPLCLVRVLWRNSPYGFPVPRFERYQGYNQIVVPAISKSPEFKIMIYPYRYGDPVPVTSWNENRTELTVSIKDVKDVYHFAQSDGGRTVCSLMRNGTQVLTSKASPARPTIEVRGVEYDSYALRDTRMEKEIPVYPIVNKEIVKLSRVQAPAEVRYTLDGSEPTSSSLLYEKPIVIDKSLTLKAKTFNSKWEQGEKESATVVARFVKTTYASGLKTKPLNSMKGVATRIYEINTKIYDDKGFFSASKIMMPKLDDYKCQQTTYLDSLRLPHSTPQSPLEEQCKAFYRINAWFYADGDGIYRFSINSCGPVTLDIANRTVIERTGMFHQQQDVRSGEVALGKGWHSFELVVCDPLYWNINSLDIMPFEVLCAKNGEKPQVLSADRFCYTPIGNVNIQKEAGIPVLQPMKNIPKMRQGFNVYSYDCIGKRMSSDFLDIDNSEPYNQAYATSLESRDGRNIVRAYNGYFYAPVDGLYSFNTPLTNGEGQHLGARQASCINQLKIGNEVIVQRGVYGRNPLRQVKLQKGWYPVSIRLGVSGTDITVTYPDGSSSLLNGDNVFCDIQPKQTAQIIGYDKPIGMIDFNQWNGKQGVLPLKAGFDAWIGYGASIGKGQHGTALSTPMNNKMFTTAVDVNVARDYINPAVRVYNLKLNENAMTVALWFKSDELSGSLFGKTGYNAYGKGYNTVSCELNNGSLYANPGHLRSKKLEAGKWYHVVLSASEEQMALYVDGEQVATAPGSTKIATDALDFFLNHHAIVENIRIYNVALPKKDVETLYRLGR